MNYYKTHKALLERRALSALFLLLALTFNLSSRAAGPVRPSNSAMAGGQVLNCFGWKYKTITAYVDTIKNHGFTAVQVSTVQPIAAKSALEPSEGNFTYHFNDQDKTPIHEWYRIYMPLDLRVINNDDYANGNAPLGTLDEFKAMITACHNKGIAVIVGIEANQVAATGYNTDLSSYLRDKYKASDWDGTGAWTGTSGNPFTDPTRKAFTEKSINPAVRDLKTEDQGVINKVKSLISTLYSDSVDGIYWYHAKYIGLRYGQTYRSTSYDMPANTKFTTDEGSEFWPSVWKAMNTIEFDSAWNSTNDNPVFNDTVLNVTPKMFSYVNLNLDPYCKGEKFVINSNNIPAIDHDPAYFREDMSTLMTNDADNYYRPAREYTKYGRVVDAWFGKSSAYQDGLTWPNGYWTTLQSTPQFYNGWTAADLSGFYAAEPSDMVYRVEDEDTYFNNPEVMYEPMSPNNVVHENRTTNTDMSTYYKNSDNKVPTLASIDRGYADMCGHNDATTVYFARPFTAKSTYSFGDDVGDIEKYYCYYEDTRDWAKKGKTLTAKYKTGENNKTTTDGFIKVGENNGHEVYMWMTNDEIADGSVIHFTDGHEDASKDTVRVNTTLDLFFHNHSLYDVSAEEKPFTALTDANKPTAGDKDGFITVYACITNDLAFPVKSNGDIGDVIKKDGKPIMRPYLDYSGSGWNRTGFGEAWPGKEFTDSCTDGLGRKWYYIQISNKTDNIIINNGIPDGDENSKYKRQTGDITGLQALLGTNKQMSLYYRWDGVTNKANWAEGSVPQELPDVVSHPTPLRFTNSVVTQANLLHQKLRGERESKTAQYNHDNTGANIGSICRKDGAILIMRDPSNHAIQHTITNSDGKLTAGSYKDHITGNTFTVDGSSITGTIGSTGVAVLYDESKVATNVANITPEDGSISTGNFTVSATRADGAGDGTVEVDVANNLAFADYTDYTDGSNAYNAGKNANMRCTRMKLTSAESTQSVNVNYFKENGSAIKSSSDLDWGLWGVSSTPIYVRVKYNNEVNGEIMTYSLLNNASVSQMINLVIPEHLLYFHFSDDLKPEQFSIYAWDQEGDKEVPLLRTGTYLAKEQLKDDGSANDTAYVRPIKGLYKMVTTSGTTRKRVGRRIVTVKYNNNYDGVYLHDMGVESGTYKETNGALQIKESDFDDINNTPYSLTKGTSFNDVIEVGGMKISRFTVGIPNIKFQNVKIKLTYHSPQGFTQELPTLDINDDAFFDVQLDKLTNNCNIGKMYVMGGTAIYDNSQWKYYNSEDGTAKYNAEDCTLGGSTYNVNGGVFWNDQYSSAEAAKKKYAHATLLSYDAAKSQDMSQGQTAEVYTYTGEFMHGGTMRFGTPYDFQTNFVEETDESKIPDDASDYKVYLKPVISMRAQRIWSSYKITTRMARSRWCPDNDGKFTVKSGTLTDFVNNTYTKADSTYNDITWKLPSGRYTLTFYHVNKDDNDIYYYTVTHPTYATTSYEGAEKLTTEPTQGNVKGVLNFAKDENGDALAYKYGGEDDANGYFRQEIDHVGAAGYFGTDIEIDSINGTGSNVYSIEGAVTGNNNIKTYASLYPETGKYRIIYRQQHKDPAGANTKGLVGTSNTYARPAKNGDNDWDDKGDKFHYLLGFNAINYTNIKTSEGDTLQAAGGFWKSYSDGMPRIKPAGVKAYYISGYVRKESTHEVVGMLGTELQGDTLPANTGLLLYYTKASVSSDNFTEIGGSSDYSTLWLEAANGSEGVRHQAGVNFLKPYIATDNYATDEWAKHVSQRDGNDGNEVFLFGKTRGGVFGFGHAESNYGNNYELRVAYASIPKSANDNTSGDIVFNAPRHLKSVGNGYEIVTTAKVDVVIGDDAGLATGITNINANDDDDSDAPVYNLAGQRVSNPHHGVFIKNGKKLIIRN